MTDALVVDASVAIKWVLDEEHSDSAYSLLSDSLKRRIAVVAPALLPSEVVNGLHQIQRRKIITQDEADSALEQFLALPIHLVSPPELFVRALSLARVFNLPATYDSQYLAIAQWIEATLWTADEKLIRSLPKSVLWVRWIGDYSSTER